MTNEVVLELKDVDINFRESFSIFSKEKNILRNISLSLFKGETLGVLGSNGAGKSTLLSLLAGVVSPDKGTINTFKNNVALLNLNLGMDVRLSGRRNAVLQGLFLGYSYNDIFLKMPAIIELSGLSAVIDKPFYTYSSGMKARLGFSVAFHLDTDILLIDEMLGVGDAEFRRKSTYLLKQKINSDQTVVLVTHNIKLLKHLSDRVLWLEDGQVKKITGPEELDNILD
ncbi:ABC transporter ATP-binding protein [Thalassotalea piscium]|uniref:Lipopolysaccharide transport system ATP-binding protein n=1 Tax=Thalassotalea piscium TaxID=1230533 RepID=A0A7X0NG13_9GAMM|nr:ATP-binding cassette domain-containing protein [Thalassotalea piscium]MBB6542784.1 lipopolysaccharide transport system ATP-binding protein [Thalassotalea piscium]